MSGTFLNIILALSITLVAGLSVEERLAELEKFKLFTVNELKAFSLEAMHVVHMESADIKDPAVEQPMESSLDMDEVDAAHHLGELNRKYRRTRQVSEARGVAFSSYLDHNLDSIAQHQTIQFNQVVTNEGNGYNASTGVFTCPMDGVYLFSFFIGGRDPSQSFARLVVNNNEIVDAAVEPSHNSQDLQGGNVAILRLSYGDTVRVTLEFNSQHIESQSDYRITTFSGVLLFK